MKSFLHSYKTVLLLALLISVLTLTARAQNNVGIGTITPNSKAILELQAVDKGFLAPRITTVQMNGIVAPPNGLLVYNTTKNCFYYFNTISNSWKDMCSIGAAGSSGTDTLFLNLVKIDSLFSHLIKADSVFSHITITNYLKADSAFIQSLITNYIKGDSAYIKQLVTNSITTNYITADSAYIKSLVSNYIIIDSIQGGYGRYDSLFIGGQNITDYLNTLISSKDTVVIKYLKTDSIQTLLIKADSAYIQNLLTNTITTQFIQTDSIKAHFASVDSLYIGGKNILDIITDSIAAQAWLLKGNNVSVTNFIGTINNASLRVRTNNTERMIIDSSGRVGIGTTTPLVRVNHAVPNLLDVRGGGVFQGRLSLTRYGEAPILGNPTWHIDNDSNYRAFRIFRQPDIFSTGFVAVLIDSTGNTGIGSYPKAKTKLDVNGKVRILGQSDFTLALDSSNDLALETNNTNRRLLFGGNGSGYTIQSTELSSGLNLPLSLNTLGGNVGIGLINPANKLEITQGTAGNSGLRFTNLPNAASLSTNASGDVVAATTASAPANGLFWSLTGNSGTTSVTNFVGTTDAQDLATRTNNIERMRVLTNGNVGIGTSTPTAYVHTQKDVNTPITPANFFTHQTDMFNNSTITAAGNITGSLTRIFNNASGTMKTLSASVVGSESSFNNDGNFTTGGANAFGTYNYISNNGTFSLTGEADGSYARVINQTGKTMTVPSTRGSLGIVRNEGTLNGSSSFGIVGSFENTSIANLSSEVSAGYFNIENSVGATLTTNAARGQASTIRNFGTLNGGYLSGSQAGIEFKTGSTTTMSQEAKGMFGYIDNSTGSTATVPYTKASQSYLVNRGSYTGNAIWATESYLHNEGILNATLGGLRGVGITIINYPTGTITSTGTLSAEINTINRGVLNDNNQVTGGALQVTNEGTLTSPYVRGGYFSVANQTGATITASKQVMGSAAYINNSGTMTTAHLFGNDVSMYNKGNLHSGHQRGVNIYMTNDTTGVLVNDSSYIASVIEVNNFGNLTVMGQDKTIRGTLTQVQNLPSSTTTTNRLIALESNVSHLGNGIIPSAYGIVTNVTTNGPGAITDAYGLYIGNVQATANRFGIYQGDIGAKNYFGGNVGIGTTTPTEKLHVNGKARIVGNSDFTLPLTTSNDLALETNNTNRRLLFGGNGSGYTIQSTELSSGLNAALSLNPYGGNVGIGTTGPTEKLEVQGSVKIVDGTQGAGKVLTSDAAGKASWQAVTGFGATKIAATGTFTCPWNGPTAGAGFATGMSVTIPSNGWYIFESGLTVQTNDCNDYWLYINGIGDIWRTYCSVTGVSYMVPRDQTRILFLNAGTYTVLAGKTQPITPTPTGCDQGNPSLYINFVKVQN